MKYDRLADEVKNEYIIIEQLKHKPDISFSNVFTFSSIDSRVSYILSCIDNIYTLYHVG